MEYVGIIKLAADLILCAALILIGLRFLRTPSSVVNSKQVIDLEASLRALLQEADTAGRTLNDQLLKRQKALEKLVVEVEGAEHRARQSVLAADESRGVLDIAVEKARSAAKNFTQPSTTRHTASSELPAAELLTDESEMPAVRKPRNASPEPRRQPAKPGALVNIFGETLEGSSEPPLSAPAADARSAVRTRVARSYPTSQTPAAPTARSERGKIPAHPLTSRIERTVEEEPEAVSSGIEEVYAAAEKMIRTGSDLSQVSSKTELPVEEIQLIKRMLKEDERNEQLRADIERMEAEEQKPTQIEATTQERMRRDPRLGVLGTMRRQVEVL